MGDGNTGWVWEETGRKEGGRTTARMYNKYINKLIFLNQSIYAVRLRMKISMIHDKP